MASACSTWAQVLVWPYFRLCLSLLAFRWWASMSPTDRPGVKTDLLVVVEPSTELLSEVSKELTACGRTFVGLQATAQAFLHGLLSSSPACRGVTASDA